MRSERAGETMPNTHETQAAESYSSLRPCACRLLPPRTAHQGDSDEPATALEDSERT